ncbi:MAG: aspartate ammonia-lyase [Euryarchaeota archaeon]|nr:aspartate ammonia-lyase [Euryarchaeota archaeon]
MDHRVERDTLGEVSVPKNAYYGAQTQRAVENFPVSGLRLQARFVRAQGTIKKAAATANMEAGGLDRRVGEAIVRAAQEVIDGRLNDQFVVDVYQAGAGTSQNMNANEVIANRAIELLGGGRGDYRLVHPNDHVNMGQSTNDTIPTAIHIAALEGIERELIPALEALRDALGGKAREFHGVIKAGRTHLQDAVPIRLGQEFGAYAAMVDHGIARVKRASGDLLELNLGGNAVGTGINTRPGYAERAVEEINKMTKLNFRRAGDLFEATQNTDAVVDVSGTLRVLATSLMKIADDLRLLSSGPRTGLREINLPAVQPGSSIMPGKVNPVMAEMLDMVCFQVIGNDAAVARAGQAGQLELNVMMPVIAYNILNSIEILTGGVRAFTERCVRGITCNPEICAKYAELSTAVVTALSPRLGYEKAAALAKEAFERGMTIRELVLEKGLIPEEELRELLDLEKMA